MLEDTMKYTDTCNYTFGQFTSSVEREVWWSANFYHELHCCWWYNFPKDDRFLITIFPQLALENSLYIKLGKDDLFWCVGWSWGLGSDRCFYRNVLWDLCGMKHIVHWTRQPQASQSVSTVLRPQPWKARECPLYHHASHSHKFPKYPWGWFCPPENHGSNSTPWFHSGGNHSLGKGNTTSWIT